MSHFYLYGPSGAGKTTTGRLLADRLGLPFYDLDDRIEAAAGAPIPEIFARDGESDFRRIEKSELARMAGDNQPAVIALGGGALLDEDARKLAERSGRALCLRAESETILSRLDAGTGVRPLLSENPAAAVEAYLERRAAHYDSFELQLDTTDLTPAETAAAAGRIFGAFRVSGVEMPYDVRVTPGILDRIPQLLEDRGLAGPFALVADDNTSVYAHRIAAGLETAGTAASVISIRPGEDQKTIETIQTLWTSFLDAGLERSSTVLAVGGGVVGDLSGFAAATFQRGIAWVAVPTSLLAMVDASLGGKTGADLPQGKNLVGAFHSPRLVAADPEALATLPARELRNGLAEVVKAAVIGEPDLFERLSAWEGGEIPVDWIARSMDVKIGIISADPFESGLRAVLNFGHTVGHAVEHASGYRLAHGEAVAIGMAVETRLAESLGIAQPGLARRISACLTGIGLPVEIPAGLDPNELAGVMQVDKKKLGGKLRFALPGRIGEVRVVEVDVEQLSKHTRL